VIDFERVRLATVVLSPSHVTNPSQSNGARRSKHSASPARRSSRGLRIVVADGGELDICGVDGVEQLRRHQRRKLRGDAGRNRGPVSGSDRDDQQAGVLPAGHHGRTERLP